MYSENSKLTFFITVESIDFSYYSSAIKPTIQYLSAQYSSCCFQLLVRLFSSCVMCPTGLHKERQLHHYTVSPKGHRHGFLGSGL